VAGDAADDATIHAIRAAVARATGAAASAVVLVARGTVPKTSSGKIRRASCRAQFLDDQLDALREWGTVTGRDQPA
jgi:acyl-CoA synthetase (AMP-forming)/AMP-acid ligase II